MEDCWQSCRSPFFKILQNWSFRQKLKGGFNWWFPNFGDFYKNIKCHKMSHLELSSFIFVPLKLLVTNRKSLAKRLTAASACPVAQCDSNWWTQAEAVGISSGAQRRSGAPWQRLGLGLEGPMEALWSLRIGCYFSLKCGFEDILHHVDHLLDKKS